jgi:hypothetical protein
MIETIIVGASFSVLLILLLWVVVINVGLRKKWREISVQMLQTMFDNELLTKHLDELTLEIEQREVSNTDGFVKFLSESRDYAFTYIEDVQKNLVDFKNAVEPIFDYFFTYGQALGESPHGKIVKDIHREYLKLKTIIPDEQGENNEQGND